jgi:hypothetical protein
MLDAIAQVDNLGIEDSTLVADASTTSLDTNAALSESQGSSMQQTDFNQSMTDMLSTLDATANTINPSLKIVSGQSLQAALADAIPGLDPTTVTPPAPLAQDSSLKTSTTAAPSDPKLGSVGEAFQTVSDGFEGLSNSFGQLAASFLGKDNFDSTAIGGDNGDNDDADADLGVKNFGDDAGVDIHSGKKAGKHSNKTAIANDANADGKDGKVKVAIGGKNAGKHSDKMAIADDTDDTDAADTINAGFGISNITNDNSDADFGINNINFDALKVNVDQVSQGLQSLVQQLEAAFESDNAAVTTEMSTTEMLTSVTR